MPIFFLFTLDIVFGRQISPITGHSALFGSVPMSPSSQRSSGSSVGAIGLIRERADGLLARLWVLPVHRASGVLSRLLPRLFGSSSHRGDRVCRTATGFPVPRGLIAGLAWLIVPLIFGVAFATLVTTAAFYSASSARNGTTLVEGIAIAAHWASSSALDSYR